MAKGLKWFFGFLVILLVDLALIDQVATRVFNFDLLLWLAFGSVLTSQVYAWIVAVIGFFGLIAILGTMMYGSKRK